MTVKTKGRRAEDRALKGAAQLQQQERTWGQLGEHSHLRNHPHRELRGKCSKKEAVGCDTGCGQASEVSGALSDFQAHCKLKQGEESGPSCTMKADSTELAQVPPRIPHSLPVLARLSVPRGMVATPTDFSDSCI